MSDTEYEDFTRGDVLRFLNETRDIRFEEEMTRPRVEIWPDDPYQQWALSHDESSRSLICNLPSMKASPFLCNGVPLKSIPFPFVLPRCLPRVRRGVFFLRLLPRCRGGKGLFI